MRKILTHYQPCPLNSLIHQSIHHLAFIAENPRLEAEWLLSEILGVDRSYLYTYPEQLLTQDQYAAFETLLKRRLRGEPFAYIVGRKAFWSFELEVTPETLIPRPETELLVELTLQHLPKDLPLWVADLGTGSGAIALALALERPAWHIVATDISRQALEVAKANAARLNGSRVQFYQGAWCDALPKKKYAAIVSNPPYIAPNDREVEPWVVQFEPNKALFSGEEGLEDIHQIIMQARDYLEAGGMLLLEHGVSQAESVVALLERNHYTKISTYIDLSGKPRVTIGRYNHA